MEISQKSNLKFHDVDRSIFILLRLNVKRVLVFKGLTSLYILYCKYSVKNIFVSMQFMKKITICMSHGK